jgi:hypothetical protein
LKLKKSIPAHAVLLAIYPPLFLYAQNVDITPPSDALLPIVLAGSLSLLLFLVLTFVLRNRDKAGLLVSLVVVLFFSYGHLSEGLESLEFAVGQASLAPDALLMPLWGVLLGLGLYSLLKTRRGLHMLTNVLNVVAICLVLLAAGRILSYGLWTGAWLEESRTETVETNPQEPASGETTPDIYYIILDAYTSPETLEQIWDYDNHEFVDYLTERGFYVVPDAKTNYTVTFLSLASSLNMQYINYLADELGVDSTDRRQAYQMIQDSEAVRFLRSKGYKFVHFQSGWGATGRNPDADRDIKCGMVTEFAQVLVRTTVLRPLADRLIPDDRRTVVLCTFETLPEVQQTIEAPRFVFAHILVPHPPFLFGPHGEPMDTDPDFDSRDWDHYYLGQLAFVNKKVEVLVDKILSEAETPPIIVLQGDHGSRSRRAPAEPSGRPLIERIGILNAYYLPGDGDELLYETITPVNTFRVIFNAYFGANHELLQDQVFFSRLKRPYDFTDVTEIAMGDYATD